MKSAVILGAAALASAQNASQSLCDKYTTALFKTNNATNQFTLLKYVVNTALIGNFTPQPTGSNNAVQGILNPNGTYNGSPVNLVPYFDGGLLSTNRNGAATAVNFLDGGGATPLMNLTAATDNTSNQYRLVTHLYSFFGDLLGCETVGTDPFPAYAGNPSMYTVHAFMDLNQLQMNYFIQQVGLAATSFGVTADDATTVGNALNNTFNYRCSPAANITDATPVLQAICIDPSCPIATANPDCGSYGAVLAPVIANATLAMGEGVSSSTTLLASGQTSATASTSSASTTGSSSSGSQTTSTSTGTSSSVSGSVTPASTSSLPAGNGAYATQVPLAAAMAAGALALVL